METFIFYCVRFFVGIINMNSTFAVICTLAKSNKEEKCLISFLMNVSTKALKNYLECTNIYKGTSTKKKTDLVERIAYGCMTGTLNKRDLEDISIKQANQILNKNNITIKSLLGYENVGLKKKEIKPFVKEKTFINV